MAALRIVRDDEPAYGKITKALFMESGYRKYDLNYTQLDQFLHNTNEQYLYLQLLKLTGTPNCALVLRALLEKIRSQRYGGVAFPVKEVMEKFHLSEVTAIKHLTKIRTLNFIEYKRTYNHGMIAYMFKFEPFIELLE